MVEWGGMKRAFLILLVSVLLLVSAAIQGAAGAFPGGEEKFMGIIPLWDLRVAIPCGTFAAAELIISLGVVAQVLLSVQRVAGIRHPEADYRFRQLLLSSLWCGWPLLLCCRAGLGYIMRNLGALDDFTAEEYMDFALAGAVAMVACSVMDNFLRGRWSVIPGVVALVFGVAAGYVWHGNYVAVLLPGCAMVAAGLSAGRVIARWPKYKWLGAVSAVCVLLAAGYIFHLLGGAGHEVDAGMAGTFFVVLALMSVLAVLRWLRL